MKAELVKRQDRWDLYGEDGSKIASSAPNPIGKLSIKNCEAIENGYDIKQLIKERDFQGFFSFIFNTGFREGIEAILEIKSDKKFSEKQLKYNMLQLFYLKKDEYEAEAFFRERQLEFIEYSIQSLQQTEWDVEIVTHAKENGSYTKEDGFEQEPKLDVDGCLILKRI